VPVKQRGEFIMKTKNREEQLAFLKNMKDEDVNFSDDHDITDDEIKIVRPNHLFYKSIKSKANFTLDKDVIAWLREHENASGYLNELVKKEMLKQA
jgi:hypothetical protein